MDFGFEGAPLTCAISALTLTSSLFIDSSLLSLDLNATLSHAQIWVTKNALPHDVVHYLIAYDL